MLRAVLGSLVVLLALTACGGGGYVETGVGAGWGWYDWYGVYDPWGWYPYALAAGDLDGDDLVDVVVADGEDGAVYVFRGARNAKLEDASSVPFIGRTEPRWIDAGRFDADRLLDLVLVGRESSSIETYLGDASGGFLPAPGDGPLTVRAGVRDVCVGDLDGDGLTDLVVLDGSGLLRIYLCRGRGCFQATRGTVDLSDWMPRGDEGGIAIACGAFDDRRGLDVAVVSAAADKIVLLTGDGAGGLERGVTVVARVPDVLLDAAPCVGPDDVHLALLYRPDDARTAYAVRLLLHGEAAGTLVRALDVGEARGLTAVDVDGDGLPDLLVIDPSTGALRVYRAQRR